MASFQSFRGFTSASWAESNGFTRLMTIAAVCNRAKFAGEAGSEEGGEGEAGVGSAAAAAVTVPVPGPIDATAGVPAAPLPRTTTTGPSLPPPTGTGDPTGLRDTASMAKTSRELPHGAMGG